MSSPAIPLDYRLPRADRPHATWGWWGMALLCATELSLFAYLLGSYFYLGSRSPAWPPPGIAPPGLPRPMLMTTILLLSSAALHWGERGIKKGNRNQLIAGLLGAIGLGLGFLGLFGYEYYHKIRIEHILPTTHAYASAFYTITSFHAAHLCFGLLLMGYTLVRAVLGHFGAGRRLGVATTSLYWHFVDGVWLVVFTCLYLGPKLG